MEDALLVLEKEPPDVVLTDLGLPIMSGTEGIRILKERHPDLTILALTVDNDDAIIRAFARGHQAILLRPSHAAFGVHQRGV